MSYPFEPFPDPPGTRIPKRAPSLAGGLAALALLAAAPAAAQSGYSYGHAEITVGFPNGQITLGKTWETEPRTVVVEKVVHELPADEDSLYEDEEAYDDEDEYEVEKRVIVRKKPVKKVIIVEQEDPCGREVEVIRRVVYAPAPRVVVVNPPVRYYPPRRHVIVVHPGGGHHRHHGRGHGHGHRGHGHGRWNHGHGHNPGHGQGHGGIRIHDGKGGGRVIEQGHRPRDLFPSPSQRPSRERGVRKVLIQGR